MGAETTSETSEVLEFTVKCYRKVHIENPGSVWAPGVWLINKIFTWEEAEVNFPKQVPTGEFGTMIGNLNTWTRTKTENTAKKYVVTSALGYPSIVYDSTQKNKGANYQQK